MTPDKLLLWVHVAAGLGALLVAPVAMVVHKGGQNHRLWGKVYFWLMLVIFVTALGLFWTLRTTIFLLFIAVLSFHAAFTGYRVLYRKRPLAGQTPTWLDWSGTGIALGSGVGFVAWGAGTLLSLIQSNIPGGFGVLGLVFGLGLLSDVRSDIQSYLKPATDKNWWWFYHMNRMLGSYVAVVTAFSVNNIGRHLPFEVSWLVWVAPTLIATPLIGYWMRHYEQKFSRPRERQPQPVATTAVSESS